MKDLVSKPYLSVSGKDKYGKDLLLSTTLMKLVWSPWGNREGLAPLALALEKSASKSAPNGKPIFIIGIYMTHYWFGKWCGFFLLHFPGPSLVKCLFKLF